MGSTRRHIVRRLLSVLLVSVAVAPLRALAQSATDDPQTDADSDPTSSRSNFGRAEWMRIPRIGVDAHISEVTIIDGYYDVPWFDVGHHVDSHAPGEPGN